MAVTGQTTAGTVASPGTTAPAVPNVIARTAERTALAQRVMRGLITEVPFTEAGESLDLLTLDALTASAYTENTTRTFTAGTPTAVTYEPGEIDVAMSFTDKAMRRTVYSMPSLYGEEIGRAVAVKLDGDGLALLDDYAAGNDVDEGDSVLSIAKLLNAIANVRVGAADQVTGIGAVCHTALWDDAIIDSNVINAQVRGNTQGLFSGEFNLIGGGVVRFSTGVTLSATPLKYQNGVFTRRSMALVWKSLLDVDVWDDRDEKSTKIGGGADYAIGIRFSDEGALYTVTQ